MYPAGETRLSLYDVRWAFVVVLGAITAVRYADAVLARVLQ